MDSPNFQFGTETEYIGGDKGTGAWAVKPGPAAIDPIPLVPGTVDAEENFDVDPLWQQITFGGATGWAASTNEFHSAPRSFESTAGGTFTIFNDFFSEQISFWLKNDMVPSGPDSFEIKIDGTTVLTVTNPADWTYYAIPTGFGYQIDFIFTKNFPFTSDCWVDDLITGGLDTPGVPGSPAHPLVYTPFHLTEDNKLYVTLLGDTVSVTGRALDCSTDSVTICQGLTPLTVEITNIPHVVVDSVPEIEIKNDIGNPIPVSFSRLSCATDSVEICNDAGSPITVNVENIPHVVVDSVPEIEIKNDIGNPVPVSFSRLSCATDSVEICNDAGSPITVNVNNTVTFIPGRRSLRGLYYGSSGAIAYASAAQAATGGSLWIVNTSNSVVAYIREVRFTSNIASLALLTALPRINIERMTFTGTPSGAQITPAKRDSLDPANTATTRTASTGMTITAGAVVKSFSPPSSDVIGGLLAANASSAVPVEQIFVGDIDSFIVLRQNEGIVFRQATAGSATENRTYNVDFMWEEI